jgi:hypothetical protein
VLGILKNSPQNVEYSKIQLEVEASFKKKH